MPKAHRPPGEPDADPLGSEIACLRNLDIEALRVRWRMIFRRDAPPHLPRHLLFAIFDQRKHLVIVAACTKVCLRSPKL